LKNKNFSLIPTSWYYLPKIPITADDYYYSGSGWSCGTTCDLTLGLTSWHLKYYFLEDNNSHIEGYNGPTNFAFIPIDQQQIPQYYQYGLFWLYNWFHVDSSNNMMNIYFLMNGNIFNYSLASVNYNVNGQQTYIIPPNPPANTINGEPIFAQSYINAYNTAFNQPNNNQNALNNYNEFTYDEVNSNNFVPGTFGYDEEYNSQGSNLGNSITIDYLQDDANYYDGTPYLFVSAGSGGGTDYMYLDWVIVTYGVPYVASVS
jgi:hypothetical protein